MTRLLRPLLCAVLLLVLGPAARAEEYPHLKMGNPSKAREDARDKDNYLMAKKYFALSYNNEKGTPNWVSWRVVKEDLGNAPRKPFHPDASLPAGFHRITPPCSK